MQWKLLYNITYTPRVTSYLPTKQNVVSKRRARHVLLRATCARGLYVWHKCERQLRSALTFLTYKAKLSQACDLSTESTTTFNRSSLAASQVLQAQRTDKRGNRAPYLTGDDKQLGRAVWVSGIGYLQKQGENREGYFWGEMLSAAPLQTAETFSRLLQRKGKQPSKGNCARFEAVLRFV